MLLIIQGEEDRHLLDTPNLERSTTAYRCARGWADRHGIRIRNATRGGHLEVFERADLDELLARSATTEHPIGGTTSLGRHSNGP